MSELWCTAAWVASLTIITAPPYYHTTAPDDFVMSLTHFYLIYDLRDWIGVWSDDFGFWRKVKIDDKKQPKNSCQEKQQCNDDNYKEEDNDDTEYNIKFTTTMRRGVVTYKSGPSDSRERLESRNPLWQGSKHQLQELRCSWQTLLNIGFCCLCLCFLLLLLLLVPDFYSGKAASSLWQTPFWFLLLLLLLLMLDVKDNIIF